MTTKAFGRWSTTRSLKLAAHGKNSSAKPPKGDSRATPLAKHGSSSRLLSRSQPDLLRQARDFAGELSELLNGTVTDGVRLTASLDLRGTAVVGYCTTRKQPLGKPVDLTTSRSPARLCLHLIQSLRLDEAGRHMATTRSTYTLQTARDSSAVLTYDYTREPANQYPAAHLHVQGEASSLQQMLNACGHPRRRPVDLHLPVGGRRFRPSLEDLIEFCILEDLVTPRSGWQDELDASRDRFHTQQLRAAVRRNPEEAASVLRDIGWPGSAPFHT